MLAGTGWREPISMSGAGKVVDGILRQRPCFLMGTAAFSASLADVDATESPSRRRHHALPHDVAAAVAIAVADIAAEKTGEVAADRKVARTLHIVPNAPAFYVVRRVCECALASQLRRRPAGAIVSRLRYSYCEPRNLICSADYIWRRAIDQ